MRVALGICFFAGCYRPVTNAEIPCAADGSCPSSQVCNLAAKPPTCVTSLADAGPADSPAADAATCFDATAVPFHICLAHAPSGTNTFPSSMTIDTTTAAAPCAELAVGSTPACVLSGEAVEIAAGVTVAATGSTPLVVLGSRSITVTGAIDVGSHLTGPLANNVGPMADGSACLIGTVPNDRGGGAGGSDGTGGGKGGDENGENGTGGTPGGVLALDLRGGCAGQPGGNDGGAAGPGGGVIVLMAPTITIESTALIDASGAGGRGAGTDGLTRGGGGGGSGGLIVFQVSMLNALAGAQVFANGGGGGGGSNAVLVGGDGSDPTGPSLPPTGGPAGGAGGSGGNGFYTPNAAAGGDSGSNGTDGGGGGGGGAGIIQFSSGVQLVGGATFSPSPT